MLKASILITLFLVIAAPASAGGYGEKERELRRDGRELVRMVRAGDAAALHARFARGLATREEVEALLAQLGPVGPRRAESAVPLGPDRRVYGADLRHGDGLLAADFVLDARDRVTYVKLRPRTLLPPDPAAAREPADLPLPLTGRWLVLWGGPDELRNYHAVHPEQRHAYDLVRWRGGATHRGPGTRNAQYHAWDRRVRAPAAATVVEAVDGIADNRPQVETDAQRPAGNHVVLDLGGGTHAVLAHLRRGTVRVDPGDRVRRGQVIGRVGNSGNSSEPHLHYHLQDAAGGFGLPLALPGRGAFARG